MKIIGAKGRKLLYGLLAAMLASASAYRNLILRGFSHQGADCNKGGSDADFNHSGGSDKHSYAIHQLICRKEQSNNNKYNRNV